MIAVHPGRATQPASEGPTKMNGHWGEIGSVSLAMAMIATGSLPAAAEPVGPWNPSHAGRMVTDADGRARHVWPPVPDEYLENAPLDEIADWIAIARSEESVVAGRTQRFEPGEVRLYEKRMSVCFVSPSVFKVKPLTPSQWNTLARRAARSLRLGGMEERGGALRVAVLMDGFPIDAAWPQDGFRVLADELIPLCMDADPDEVWLRARLTAGFALRTGNTAFLRQALGRMRQTRDAGQRAGLGVLAAACVSGQHDLNPAESVVAGAELLSLAEGLPGHPQQATIADAALRVGAAAAVNLLDDALESGNADIRRAAMHWAAERIRIARFTGDTRAERQLRARSDRMIAAISDPDEQVAATALNAVITILENEPNELAAALIKDLGARATSLDIMACYALARIPEHARSAMETLQGLSASPDPDLKLAANQALWSIQTTE